jgi:class 3 adenylate cyclase
VELGFGLHVGVSIEGAIGTDFKIDCTYMSKDVEFASYLESCTKKYGCKLLFSGELRSILSEQVKLLD